MLSTLVLACALATLGAGALGVLAFESPVRAAGSLLTACVGAAATTACVGLSMLPGVVLWVGAGGAGLLLLWVVLLLTPGVDERARRRMRLWKGLLLPPVALLGAAVVAVLAHDVGDRAASANPSPPSAVAVADVLVDEFALPLATMLAAMGATLIGGLLLARKEA